MCYMNIIGIEKLIYKSIPYIELSTITYLEVCQRLRTRWYFAGDFLDFSLVGDTFCHLFSFADFIMKSILHGSVIFFPDKVKQQFFL